MRYTKIITKISLCCGILSSLIWQDTSERAVGHYTISRDHDVTDQECGLSFPDHLPRPRQDGGWKWAGDETRETEPIPGPRRCILRIENTNQIADRSHDSVGSKAALLNGILQTENRVCRE